jgi:lipoyl(octanoyl) transferase
VSEHWRLVDTVADPRSGAEHMRADIELLDAVERGAPPAMRVYTWARPTLSLGRFQPDSDVDRRACASLGVDVVRRPTGGAALLHGADLTYAVVMPRPDGRAGTVDAVYETIARGLIAGLAGLGVEAAVARHVVGRSAVCFSTQQGADLRVGTRKLCGSAQLRRATAVLQHGSILLQRLPFDETDLVVGQHDRGALRDATITLHELGVAPDASLAADALVTGFERALDITFDRLQALESAPSR